jgi:hypothetical protein
MMATSLMRVLAHDRETGTKEKNLREKKEGKNKEQTAYHVPHQSGLRVAGIACFGPCLWVRLCNIRYIALRAEHQPRPIVPRSPELDPR